MGLTPPNHELAMLRSPKSEPTRLTHHLVTALLMAQLVLPLFFAFQIALVWAGADAFTVSPGRVRLIVEETPLLSILPPFLRSGLLGAMLYTHYQHPHWTLPLLGCSIVIHIIGWMSIIANPYFHAPTGYVTLALELAAFLLLVLNPAQRGQGD